MTRFAELLRRFRKDERGVFAVLFGILAIVLIATSGAVVDFTKTEQARTRSQTALDSAALALQGQINTLDEATLKSRAQTIVTERLNDATITAVVDTATKNVNAGTLNLQAHIEVSTAFVQFVGITSIRSNLQSEVTRASSDLEVSLSIDITGSMDTTYDRWGNVTSDKIGDLIDASNMLIDLLVKDAQTPTYSKMAIVPWSSAVNVGSYANSVRGTPTPGVTISTATWMSGTSKTISGVTRANPAVVTTSTAHGFAEGDYVYISNVKGMTNLNNNIYRVGAITNTAKFPLKTTGGSNVNSSSWTAFASGGGPKVTKCLDSNCRVLVTTSSAHGLTTGNTVYINGAGGMTALNNTHVDAVGTVPTTSSYYLTSLDSKLALYTTYTANSAKSYCTVYGCQYYRFRNDSGGYNLWQVNTCVTDRTTNAYTDTAPSTAPLSKNYRDLAGSNCIDNQIVPLTSNKATLHAAIGKRDDDPRTLLAEGTTAGHLGLAWGWYMIAPNFSYLWPTASQPKAYGSANLIKAVVFMTDGVFNTTYCNGVISEDSSATDDASQIDCASPNGSSKSQAETICTNIKAPANDTLLYVVGFDLAGDEDTLEFLEDCATSSEHFFQADDGTDLEEAFRSIYESLSDLRLSK